MPAFSSIIPVSQGGTGNQGKHDVEAFFCVHGRDYPRESEFWEDGKNTGGILRP
jgi:hypothetical protein